MKKLSVRFTLVLFCCVMIYSCDDTLEPIDRDTGIFAIYGFLDLNEQTSYIRVRDLNAPFTKDATETLDATVSLQNLSQGSANILESEVREYEGVYLHTFVYQNEVIPDNEYKLTVERSDGAVVVMSATTPTMPEPHVKPLNQNCFIPIDFEMGPLNGGTVVLRVGLGPEENDPWGGRQVLKPGDEQPSDKITFTFVPHEEVIEISPGNVQDRRCGDELEDGRNIYISYIHYGPGFYEQVADDSFDIMNTQRFGAAYFDTVVIPVDVSEVCPPDC